MFVYTDGLGTDMAFKFHEVFHGDFVYGKVCILIVLLVELATAQQKCPELIE